MAATASPLAKGALIRCTLPGRKQPRIYSVAEVARNSVTLRLAWREGERFPILGKPKVFKPSALQNVEPYSEASE